MGTASLGMGPAGALTLLALVTEVTDKLKPLYDGVLVEARRLAAKFLAPAGPIPKSTVKALLRRAIRNGAWRLLTREEKALLIAAAKALVKVYRSPQLLNQLRAIWIRIEEVTIRGKAVIAAIAYLLLQNKEHSINDTASSADLGRILALGIQLLNNPTVQHGLSLI